MAYFLIQLALYSLQGGMNRSRVKKNLLPEIFEIPLRNWSEWKTLISGFNDH